jgi:hypothetical protein
MMELSFCAAAVKLQHTEIKISAIISNGKEYKVLLTLCA